MNFNDLMKGFGVVTVMDACIYTLKDGKAYTGGSCGHLGNTQGALTNEDWEFSGEILDTLKIANLTQEGPTKEIKGGKYANSLIKFGKTTTAEIQDALGRASTLVRFFGADYNGGVQKTYTITDTIVGDGTATAFYIMKGKIPAGKIATATWTASEGEIQTKAAGEGDLASYVKVTFAAAPAANTEVVITCQYTDGENLNGTRISIGDKFPGAFAIEGTTFFIDQKTGEQVPVFIFIPQFLPEAILTLTQDAEGDAAVFDLNGTLNITKISDDEGERTVFYEIREKSFFDDNHAKGIE